MSTLTPEDEKGRLSSLLSHKPAPFKWARSSQTLSQMDHVPSAPPTTRAAATAAAEQAQKPRGAPRQRGERAQPWRAHWPPRAGESLSTAYGFKKGEAVRIYGN